MNNLERALYESLAYSSFGACVEYFIVRRNDEPEQMVAEMAREFRRLANECNDEAKKERLHKVALRLETGVEHG